MTQTKIKLFYKLSLFIFKVCKLSLFIFKVIFTIFNDDILIYIIDWNVYTQSKSKDEKHKSAKGNTGEKRKHWPTNAGQRELDTKVQRALLEKLLGRKETFASKYRAAKAGHISAKGNRRKKLMGRKENIGLQIRGSKSWTHKCKGHWRKDYWG